MVMSSASDSRQSGKGGLSSPWKYIPRGLIATAAMAAVSIYRLTNHRIDWFSLLRIMRLNPAKRTTKITSHAALMNQWFCRLRLSTTTDETWRSIKYWGSAQSCPRWIPRLGNTRVKSAPTVRLGTGSAGKSHGYAWIKGTCRRWLTGYA